jgi:hypothetical protein
MLIITGGSGTTPTALKLHPICEGGEAPPHAPISISAPLLTPPTLPGFEPLALPAVPATNANPGAFNDVGLKNVGFSAAECASTPSALCQPDNV